MGFTKYDKTVLIGTYTARLLFASNVLFAIYVGNWFEQRLENEKPEDLLKSRKFEQCLANAPRVTRKPQTNTQAYLPDFQGVFLSLFHAILSN